MSKFALELTTTLKPAKKIKVDGEPYDLLGVDHLSPEEEAEVMALFSRYAILNGELEVEPNVEKGKAIALRMKATRLTILTKLTSMPKEVAGKLPLTQQVKLYEAIQDMVQAEDDEDDEPAADDKPGVSTPG